MQKVYVVTTAAIFNGEKIQGAYASKKDAEKALRREYPHMRMSDSSGRLTSYAADASRKILLFIHELEVVPDSSEAAKSGGKGKSGKKNG